MRDKDTEHLKAGQLDRFFAGELGREEVALVVRHLLTQCQPCQEFAAVVAARYGVDFGETAVPIFDDAERKSESFSDIFLKLLERRGEEALEMARERLQGIGLLSELEKHESQDRFNVIRTDPRFHHWGLFDRMLVKYLEYSRNSPEAGIQTVLAALVVLDHLPPGRLSDELLADFRASAFGALGNANRLAGSFDEARMAFVDAWETIEDGTGDPVEEANLLSLEASLFYDLGQFDRSTELLDRAAAIYQSVGDDNRRARTRIQQALAIGYLEPFRGIDLLREALQLIDAAEEPRLELCARHNLAWFLNDAGEPREALSLLEASRPLYRSFADSWTQLRLHWLEGRIARTLGDLANAEAVFQKISRAFETRGMHFEQTMVAIDLVELYSLQGRLDVAITIIDDFLPVLTTWGMHVEGLAMWMLFRESLVRNAAQRTAVEESAFRSITAYFHRSWNRPMRFEDKKRS